MFMLTVEAHTTTPDALRRHVFGWAAGVGTSAAGWLGNTAGVSSVGDFILLMRFESEEAAWITSDLPEYGQWWQICARHLDTKPVFTGSTHVSGILGGGSDDAAAVRITRGSAAPNRFRSSLRQIETLPFDDRAAMIGGIVAWHDRNRFTEALYFASKDLAQFRHRGTTPTPLRRFIDDHDASILDGTMADLDDPWLISPLNVTSSSRTEREAR
jgi:hypothetical protein